MSCVNEPPGIQDSQMNDAKDSTKLTSNGVNGVNGVSENGEFRRSDRRRSSSKKLPQSDSDKLCNGTVNPAFMGDSDDQLTSNPSYRDSNKEEESPNPNYLVNEDAHLKGMEALNETATTNNGSAPRIIVPEDALLNHHSGRIRLKKKEAANNKENDAKDRQQRDNNMTRNNEKKSDSVVIPMNGVLHNGHVKEKGEKETTMTVSDNNSQQKVKEGVPVSSPLTSEKTDPKKSTLEEYFIPANTHKKFLRGEKLYLTNEKRKGGCSWKKVAISGCLLALLAAAVLIGVLAATGILPAGQSDMFTASSPTLELPAQASVSMRGHGDTVIPRTSSATTDRTPVTTSSTITPRRRTTLLSATREPTSATIATNLVSQLPIVTMQAPVIVPSVLKGDLTVVNRNFSDSNIVEYENIRTELEAELSKVFNDTDGFINVNVTRLQAGSIKVQFVTSFSNSKYDPREIQKVIQAYLDKHNGYLNRFLVDPESVAVKIPKNECEVNNGGCTDICTWDSTNYLKMCSCSGEQILEKDHLTCFFPTEPPVVSTTTSTTTTSPTTTTTSPTTTTTSPTTTTTSPTTTSTAPTTTITSPTTPSPTTTTTMASTTTSMPTTERVTTTEPTTTAPITTQNRALLSPETTIVPLTDIPTTVTTTTSTFKPETTVEPLPELLAITTTTTSEPKTTLEPMTEAPTTTSTSNPEPTIVPLTELVNETTTTTSTTSKPETTVSETTTLVPVTVAAITESSPVVPVELYIPVSNDTTSTTDVATSEAVTETVSNEMEVTTIIATHSSDRGEGRSFTGNDTEVTLTPEIPVTGTEVPDKFMILNIETTEKTSTLISQLSSSEVVATESSFDILTTTTITPISNEEEISLNISAPENISTSSEDETFSNYTSATEEINTTSENPTTLNQSISEVSPVTETETPMFISHIDEEKNSTTQEIQDMTSPSSVTLDTSLTQDSTTTTLSPSELIILVGDNDTAPETSSSVNSIASVTSTVSASITSTETTLSDAGESSTTESATRQAENTRFERNSEPTPAAFFTEVNRPSDNGTILSSILENDSTNSSNDFSTEIGDEMINVDTEITTTVEDEDYFNSTTVFHPTTTINSLDSNQSNETLTTQSLFNDTLVDELTTVASDVLNFTKIIEDDSFMNESSNFSMLNSTGNSTETHEDLTSVSPDNVTSTTTTSDVVSISGRRLDDDTNSTITYDEDFPLNATAYDGLVYMNDTLGGEDNSTILESGFKLDNETDEFGVNLVNETTMIDDTMTSGDPHVTNASIIEGCDNDEFRCNNDSDKCFKKKQICDGFQDCPDGFDESDCSIDCGYNFLCTNSSSLCIKAEARCDGVMDCDDGSDEEECGGKAYCDRIQQVSCSDNSYCIKPLEICDGHYNCLDRSDERDCVDRSACQASGSFFCNDNLCLPPGLRCDGIKDCQQGEDEDNCKCNNTMQFECPNGECLPLSKRCDGSQDCNDGSDEMECFKVDPNGVIHVLDGPSKSWGLLCDDPDYPWSVDGGDELCQELGFSAAQSVGHLKVAYMNATHYHQWLPYLNSSTGYWLANTERRNSCYSDSLATVACVKYECGDLKHEDGSRKKVEQWPFMTTIRGEERQKKDQNWDDSRVKKKIHVCRADILTPLWLITSVGCLTELTENYTDWEVRVQQVELLSLTLYNNMTQTRKVKSVLTHPHSSVFRSLILYDYDMALIRLEKPLKFGNNMAAVCLPDEEVKPGITCFTSSFNSPEEMDPNKQMSTVHYMTMMVEERDKCNEGEHYNGGVGERMLCTKNKEINYKLCEKDIAASLSCISINEKWYLAGILSYQRYCEAYKKHPAVYANIHAMRNYIEKVVGMKMYNVTVDQNITYLPINHDAAYIDNPDLALNSVRPLEPYSTYSNETYDWNVTEPLSFDEFDNSTATGLPSLSSDEENGNVTATEMGVELESADEGSRNESESSTYLPPLDDNRSNDTITDISMANDTDDSMRFEAVEFVNDANQTSNSNVSSSSYSMDDGALNSIDQINETVTANNETLTFVADNETFVADNESIVAKNESSSVTIDPDNIEIRADSEDTNTTKVPKPVTVYDSDSTASSTTEVPTETTTVVISNSSTEDNSPSTTTTITYTEVSLGEEANITVPTIVEPHVTSKSNQEECEGDVFRCLGSPSCVPSNTVCDGIHHCPDQSDEWSCIRLNQSTSVLEIRHHSFGWSSICSDNWTGDLSHKVCHQLGYPSALLTGHVALSNDSMDMLLQVTNPNVKLVQGAVSANETAECAKKEIVSVTCSEYQCGLWSLKTEDSDTSEGRQGRRVGVGGVSTAARDGEWPSMSILRNGARTCSASILSKRWLLASWSCLRNIDADEAFTPSNWTAVTGTSTSGEDEPGPSVTRVDTILPHPSVNASNGDCGGNDVALVRLATTLSFGRFASAVCLPQTSFRPRELCVVAAWEKQNDRSSLYYQPVNTLANGENECNSTSLETDDVLCPGLVESPTFTQQNEPGAALMCINQSHHWELHGTVSAQNKCHGNVTYTNVYSHSKWIASTIKEN